MDYFDVSGSILGGSTEYSVEWNYWLLFDWIDVQMKNHKTCVSSKGHW